MKDNPAPHCNENPLRPITAAAVAQALKYPKTPYFLTTHPYWDCDSDYMQPLGMLMCENCGSLRDESPDWRVNKIHRHRIHLDWLDPAVMASMEEHGTDYQKI